MEKKQEVHDDSTKKGNKAVEFAESAVEKGYFWIVIVNILYKYVSI